MTIRNGKEIVNQIKKLRSDFEANIETEEEIVREKLSFLDRLNKLVRLILDDDTISVYDALNEDNLKEWNKKRNNTWYRIKNFIFSNARNSLYLLLLITITAFLVSEALGFYAVDGVIGTKTYVKAILTEVCFIFLSGYRTETKIGLIWVGTLRACIFVLMMFVISNQVLLEGTKEISNTNTITQQIEFIEKQIEQKEKDIKYFKEIGYPKNATRVTIEKQELVKKLILLKDKQAQGSNEKVSKVVEYRMYGRAAFRVLLLFISVLITRRIFSF
jgi:hypothetical protein